MPNVLDQIYKSAIKFLSPLGPEETFKTIVDEANKLVGSDSGSIFLDIQGQFQRVYASTSNLYKITPRTNGHIYTVYKTRRPIILQSKDVKDAHPDATSLKYQSIAILPLYNRNKSIGALTLQSSKVTFFNQEKLDILKLFTSLACLAIRKTELYDETKKALETRDLFISMASHELRTPLTTITGYIHLLRNRTLRDDSPQSRWLDELLWESQRLNSLVKELLETERIKHGQLYYNWKECNMIGIINRAISIFRIIHPDRKLVLQTPDKIGKSRVVGDYDKLLQAINNILDNAVKFSPTESIININLHSNGKMISVEIKDQGRGIEKSEKEKIFETFYRGDHQIEGMGIGLSLVKYIIASHHGLINVRSKLNRGTTMEIKLPIAQI